MEHVRNLFLTATESLKQYYSELVEDMLGSEEKNRPTSSKQEENDGLPNNTSNINTNDEHEAISKPSPVLYATPTGEIHIKFSSPKEKYHKYDIRMSRGDFYEHHLSERLWSRLDEVDDIFSEEEGESDDCSDSLASVDSFIQLLRTCSRLDEVDDIFSEEEAESDACSDLSASVRSSEAYYSEKTYENSDFSDAEVSTEVQEINLPENEVAASVCASSIEEIRSSDNTGYEAPNELLKLDFVESLSTSGGGATRLSGWQILGNSLILLDNSEFCSDSDTGEDKFSYQEIDKSLLLDNKLATKHSCSIDAETNQVNKEWESLDDEDVSVSDWEII